MIKQETEQKIVQAAEELVREGVESPTNAQVLARLGKGSLSTVSPVMREWRDKRANEKVVFRDIPASLKEMISGSITHIWIEANKQANRDLEELREKAKQEIVRAEGERDEALIENAKLSNDLQRTHERLTEQDNNHKELKEKLKTKGDQCIEISTENKLLQKQIDELKESLSKLQGELVNLANLRKE